MSRRDGRVPGGPYARIYAVVRRIPRGRVATYGQVADLAGLDGHARQVGYALHALPSGSAVPWHRVINAAGMVSRRAVAGAELTQRQLLEREGVGFDLRGRVRLSVVRWKPRTARTKGEHLEENALS
jgi:methylated-DNA-protein-cysteine methyltransferase related protein